MNMMPTTDAMVEEMNRDQEAILKRYRASEMALAEVITVTIEMAHHDLDGVERSIASTPTECLEPHLARLREMARTAASIVEEVHRVHTRLGIYDTPTMPDVRIPGR